MARNGGTASASMSRKAALFAAIDALLGGSGPPAGFVANLFGRAAVEDLEAFAPESLAAAARLAFEHLSRPRRPGMESLSLTDAHVVIDGRDRDVTVIEVVNDNMAFLLDSTLAELTERGIEALLVAHPILAVERDKEGRMVRFAGEAAAGAPAGTRRESLIQIHVDRIDLAEQRAAIADGLAKTYVDVRLAVADWAAMRGRLAAAIMAYKANPPPLPTTEVNEAIAFLEWIGADNFTFLGLRDFRYPDGDAAADPIEGTGLGILRDPSVRVLKRGNELLTVTPEVRAFLAKPVPLIITKANVKSRVHRRVHLDYVGVKTFSPEGLLEGEMRIVGLFTSDAYTKSTAAIPYLRHKIGMVLERAGLDPTSHSGRALMNVLESYPRDELFQLDADLLYQFAIDILALYERPRVRALVRVDTFDRFVSALVYIPKDRYDTAARRRVGEYLAQVYQGHLSAAYPAYPEGPLARTHYIIGRNQGVTPDVARGDIERGIADLVRTWGDSLKEALSVEEDQTIARRLAARYGEAFNAAYRDAFSAEDAIADIHIIEGLTAERPRAVAMYRRAGTEETRVNLKVFSRGAAMPLSTRVPVLENLGFRVMNERTYRVLPPDVAEGERTWLHDMVLERATGGSIDIAALEAPVEAALIAVFAGEAESDGYNALVLEAGLGWRDVALIRAMSLYLRQARIPYSQDYMWTTLTRHAPVARLIVDLFHARFDPAGPAGEARAAKEAGIVAAIEDRLGAVTSLDEDRILRRFVNLVQAMLRTNLYQEGGRREEIAFKLESRRVEDLPAPRPLYEIAVYSPRVEGVHLRFGKVARGGLRWSDRPQDFRTEVLGLVKAQQVKNAVIVPVGAKGGFIPKRLPVGGPREAIQAEGVAAYKRFVGTLLTLTDNLDGESVVPPPDTTRHDGDDPYLVVAADKGTATFSDTANQLALDHGFWLGDAFASGGSAGYDHKKMGITARGAWEAVKRHFREIDIDIQTTPFSVAGVGDMSGDVFGNGMLLSPATRLVAAFDHRDIFIDPDPDAAASLAERQRLFALPRSSWQDYDKTLISKGGGVFSRTAKSIALSPEVRAAIGLGKAEATPFEVMNAILKAPVDLLWFGGIGTYVRSSEETDDSVGDRANDAVRVAGADLRCKVIGEGANLGMTQRGRIEAGRRGIRLNTDAIDNSAGVNTSDVEVNIKIALAKPVADGRLSADARLALLVEMTEAVGALVLRNNYLQTLAISLSERRGAEDLSYTRHFMRDLEAEDRLDRAIEFLPDDPTLIAREKRNEGLTRPELAVLLAYAKLALNDMLLTSGVPDDPYLSRELQRYFPAPIRDRFPDAVEAHRLRREIVATQLANAIVNRGGPTILPRIAARTGAAGAAIAAAYALARDSFGLGDINSAIDALDARIGGAVQLDLYGAVQDAMIEAVIWFARRLGGSAIDLSPMVERYGGGIAEIGGALPRLLVPAAEAERQRHIASLTDRGVPRDLAERIANLFPLSTAPDAILVAERLGRPVMETAVVHYALAGHFRFGRLVEGARGITVTDDYERLARDRAIDGIIEAHRRLTAEVLGSGKAAGAMESWLAKRGDAAARIRAEIEAMAGSGLTLAKLVVASSLFGDLSAA